MNVRYVMQTLQRRGDTSDVTKLFCIYSQNPRLLGAETVELSTRNRLWDRDRDGGIQRQVL